MLPRMIGGILEVFQRDAFWPTVLQHIELSTISLFVGIVVSVSLAVAVSRSSRASLVAINITNLGRGIPDLAWLALFLVFVGIGPATRHYGPYLARHTADTDKHHHRS